MLTIMETSIFHKVKEKYSHKFEQYAWKHVYGIPTFCQFHAVNNLYNKINKLSALGFRSEKLTVMI